MPEETSPTPQYTMGYSPGFLQLLAGGTRRHTRPICSPSLGSGLRVLDFGCGPGTITVGLAAAVQPSEVHGVDMEASQIEMGRSPRPPAATTTSRFT